MIKTRFLVPGDGRMAILAFLPKIAVMGIVILMTVITFIFGITIFNRFVVFTDMTSGALQAGVFAAQFEIGYRMIKHGLFEANDIVIAPLMVGVTVSTLLVLQPF